MTKTVGAVLARLPETELTGHASGRNSTIAVMDPSSFLFLLSMEQEEQVIVEGTPTTVFKAMEWLVRAHETQSIPAIGPAHRMHTVPLDVLRSKGVKAELAPSYALAFVCRLRRLSNEVAGHVRFRGTDSTPMAQGERRSNTE